MKKITLLLMLLAISFIGFNQQLYSKVKIYATDSQLIEIGNLGVNIDHGHQKKNVWFVSDFSARDIEILKDNGIPHDILIEDVSAYYMEHSNDTYARTDRADCPDAIVNGGYNPTTPENWEAGSMAGFFSYEEFLDELDQMRAAYPALITEKAPISDFETWENRPIHWLRISDNADTDEDEKEVLYTSIHHAREPMSLSQNIFYMWYLLENYGTNEEVTYLLDNTELYFVPMINPDGYKHNHTTNPAGGGMHRKNRNPAIGTYNKGVDLNRNYAEHWNESGTSPDENSDVYAGISPFSEPETQAIKWFCENHDFKFAFNAHAYGDLLLFPLGWSTSAFAADNDYFQAYSDHMSMHNGYIGQKASALYAAAGDSDDWMYEDTPNIFAVTPEVGDDFWPPSASIIPTAKEMLFSNLVMAHLPHIYGVTKDLEPNSVNGITGAFSYELLRLGLTDGPIEVNLTPINGIASIGDGSPASYTLDIEEIKEDSMNYVLEAGIASGDEIKYVIHTNNGTWTRHDTITKTFDGETSTTPIFFDNCDDISNWNGDWDFTNETSYSPDNCITDSPYDITYGNNVNKEIVLEESFDLSHGTFAYVNYRAKWQIENNYDYVMFMISTNGGTNWSPLCGQYTNTGVADQNDGEGEPLYDGDQTDWVLEKIDITDYLDQVDVRFKFVLITDPGFQADGFYFDDFALFTDATGTGSGIDELTENNIRIYPNPANTSIIIKLDDYTNVESLVIYDELGQIVRHMNAGKQTIDVTELSEGIYYLQVVNKTNAVIKKRFTVIR